MSIVFVYITSSYVEGKLDPCIRVAAYTHKEELIEEEVNLYVSKLCICSLFNKYCNESYIAVSYYCFLHHTIHYYIIYDMQIYI